MDINQRKLWMTTLALSKGLLLKQEGVVHAEKLDSVKRMLPLYYLTGLNGIYLTGWMEQTAWAFWDHPTENQKHSCE